MDGRQRKELRKELRNQKSQAGRSSRPTARSSHLRGDPVLCDSVLFAGHCSDVRRQVGRLILHKRVGHTDGHNPAAERVLRKTVRGVTVGRAGGVDGRAAAAVEGRGGGREKLRSHSLPVTSLYWSLSQACTVVGGGRARPDRTAILFRQ